VPETAANPCTEPAALLDLARDVDQDLARRLDAFRGPAALQEALRYSALGGGKRMRPVLTLLSCEAVGAPRSRAAAAAAAVEIVHCFSLVHDDLPAMDDADLRRGRPSLHVQAGEAMAILAGDAMMALAFEWLAASGLPAEVRGRLSGCLADAIVRLINGQVYDTLGGFPDGLSPRERLELVHRNKTAALIICACRLGGICGGASAMQLAALDDYGAAIGLMFQVVDDLLDVTQTTEHVGKATGRDSGAGKLTFPGLHGTAHSRREVQRLRDEARRALDPLGEPAALLRELCDFMAVRTR
jgi:geranylgeranyl diphosphate synthase type II